jgi:hypothetical protein
MKNRLQITTLLFISALMLLLVTACSEGGGDIEDGTPTPPIEDVAIAQVAVDAAPSTINVLESSSVTASVYDESGSPVANVFVSFGLDQPVLAGFSPSIALTDGNGVARATLTARDKQGSLMIRASAEGISSTDEPMSILSGVAPGEINVTSNPTTIKVEGTANIIAEVLDQDGSPVPDGTTVAFDVSNPTFGSMSPAENTTINGFASSTFTALNQPGTASIEVSVGAINNSVDILINQSQPASLQFSEADPQRIAIRGSGGIETSQVRFRVMDANGNPLSGIEVTVAIQKGPEGGEYIDDSGDGSPKEIVVSSDSNGYARVLLRSGTLAGPVTLKGTMTFGGEIFATNSSVVSIGGGVPVASRFSISANPRNLPGLGWDNLETEITAYMADRYGNYNILKGTTVSFWAEPALAINASQPTVDENGLVPVTARTQHPVLSESTGGHNVDPWPWEVDLMNYVQTTHGLFTGNHPRDGWASVGVYCQGEEYFHDANANGLYDSGEGFEDTHDDPFIDYNDNDLYDDATSVDPPEIYHNSNNNPAGGWDSYNAAWDAQKDIFASSQILITGVPTIIITPDPSIATAGGFSIPNGQTGAFKILICDRNLNYLGAGSTVSVEFKVDMEDGDKLRGYAGLEDHEYYDSSFLPGVTGSYTSHLGAIEFYGYITDKSASNIAAPVILTVTVNWDGIVRQGTYQAVLSGTAF